MSLSEALSKIGAGIKKVAVTIAKDFEALFGTAAAEQFAQASIALLKSAVGTIVTQVVDDMENTTLDSTAKRETAVAQILEIAAKAGISVAESEVRLLIELAVTFVKGKVGVNASTIPTTNSP